MITLTIQRRNWQWQQGKGESSESSESMPLMARCAMRICCASFVRICSAQEVRFSENFGAETCGRHPEQWHDESPEDVSRMTLKSGAQLSLDLHSRRRSHRRVSRLLIA